ncbi:MAG: hypothetical protein ACQEXX_20310 [Bacillota bacterium]
MATIQKDDSRKAAAFPNYTGEAAALVSTKVYAGYTLIIFTE